MNLFDFKNLLTKILLRFEGFDPSAISSDEWLNLFSAFEDGAPIEDLATSIVDGSAYEKYFGDSYET